MACKSARLFFYACNVCANSKSTNTKTKVTISLEYRAYMTLFFNLVFQPQPLADLEGGGVYRSLSQIFFTFATSLSSSLITLLVPLQYWGPSKKGSCPLFSSSRYWQPWMGIGYFNWILTKLPICKMHILEVLSIDAHVSLNTIEQILQKTELIVLGPLGHDEY